MTYRSFFPLPCSTRMTHQRRLSLTRACLTRRPWLRYQLLAMIRWQSRDNLSASSWT
jgi:hypothetical protein